MKHIKIIFNLSRYNFLLAVVFTISLFFIWNFGIFIWYAPAMSARVVDENGAPVVGAIIDVSWSVRASITGVSIKEIEVREATSDINGIFKIKGWGPKFIWRGGISDDQPQLRIFKVGFIPVVLRNKIGLSRITSPAIINFRLQNKEIEIKRMYGTLEENELSFFSIVESINFYYKNNKRDVCSWTKMPKLVSELSRIKIILDRKKNQHTLTGFPKFKESDYFACNSVYIKGS